MVTYPFSSNLCKKGLCNVIGFTIFHLSEAATTSFESVFCMKTVKSGLFKKYLERRKSRARFCLSLGWLHISEKKSLKTAILLVQELRI